MPFASQQGSDWLLHCLVQPRASRDEIVGVQDGRLKLRIKAPPVDGEANAQLVQFLASACNIPRSRIEIVSGETGKRKTVRLRQVDALPAAWQQYGET